MMRGIDSRHELDPTFYLGIHVLLRSGWQIFLQIRPTFLLFLFH